MNKADCKKLRTGDVVEVSHGFDRVERCTVMGPARTSKERGARIPIKRERDNAEYTVYSSRIIGVVAINGMPTTAEIVKKLRESGGDAWDKVEDVEGFVRSLRE